MTNVASGLIVMKRCFHFDKVSSYFSPDSRPPLEPCREGGHFWNFMEAEPTFHFDLRCGKCGTVVKLDELVGIMVCTRCDETCEVNILAQKLQAEDARVRIALGSRPVEERKQLGEEKLAVLKQYFSQQSEFTKSKVEIVSHTMVKDISKCYAEVVCEPDVLFALPPERK